MADDDRPLVSEPDVRRAREAGRIAIPGDAIVTPLARDLIDRFELEVDRVAPGTDSAAEDASPPPDPSAVRVVGNWKCNKSLDGARSWAVEVARGLGERGAAAAVAVPHPHLATAADAARGSSLAVGAQDVSPHEDGSYTGAVSARMLRDAGAAFVICGHSERRALFGEDPRAIARKVDRALASDLPVILCVGETAEDRRRGRTERALVDQVRASLDRVVGGVGPRSLSLAYEPVWAIGSGETPGPADIVRAVRAIRRAAGHRLGASGAERVEVLYGGSVDAGNAVDLIRGGGADGALVGGASLEPGSFLAILDAFGDPG